eukprot:6936748-Pyramimonas_sp.AAC.1
MANPNPKPEAFGLAPQPKAHPSRSLPQKHSRVPFNNLSNIKHPSPTGHTLARGPAREPTFS